MPRSASHAVILTGVRRSGKSTLLARLLRRARTSVYLNFEDPRLYGLGPADFPALLSLLRERRGLVGLDEVQEVPEWPRLVRALLDRGRPVTVTGSSASLLGRDLGVKLTGRHLSFEVLPFSYPEFLAYTRRPAGVASLRAHLDDGGFPGYLRDRDPEVLRTLLRDLAHRDIASRHGLRQVRHLMNLTLFLMANTGRPFSLQGLTRSLSIPTVGQTSRYVEYLQDAYLLMAVPKHSTSFRKRVVAPCKYYAVDNGLRRAVSPQASPDVGHRLENAVYLALRRMGGAVTYAGERDVWECDFVTDTLAVQVCLRLDAFNREREVRGLVRAAGPPGKRRALLLTLDQADRFRTEGVTIEVVPAWKWLGDPYRKILSA